MKKPKQMKSRHNFVMLYKNPLTGKIVRGFKPAKVLIPTEDVYLEITKHGVLRSKKLKGRGSTQLCSGAICSVEQASRFPHEVTGTCDFQDTRVFIGSKDTGLGPDECYGYEGEFEWFTKMNDKKGGHDEILQMIEERDGPLLLHLRPIKRRTGYVKGTGRRGSNTSGPSGGERDRKRKGHHARQARIGREAVDV